jgi:hypothetical protein
VYNIDAYRPKRDKDGNLTVAPPLELTPEERDADMKRFSYGRIFGWWWRKPGRNAGTPLAPDEAADLDAARAEIRRGESTTDPLGPRFRRPRKP